MKTHHLILAAIFISAASLPLVLGTSSYPIAIVDGISMYPNLISGDVIIYKKVDFNAIEKGSIIVFNQGSTGFAMLDSIMRPIVIHRVTDTVIQDGMAYYRTEGDNNEVEDQFLVKYDNILGVPAVMIPRVGSAIIFLKSPIGLASISIPTILFYAYKFGRRLDVGKRKGEFLSMLAQMVLNGDLSQTLFEKLKLAIEYADNIDEYELHESKIIDAG